MKKTARKLLKFLTDPDYRFIVRAVRGAFRSMQDEEYLKLMFRARQKQPLHLENPRTFNEKLQWLKLNDRHPEHCMMVDKYEVKEYVARKISPDLIIPTLGLWEDADDIDFDRLPGQFVLKATHDSHGLVVCKDKSKLNIRAARKKLNRALKRNYYHIYREWPYKSVKPRIIAEAYLEDSATKDLRDYKFFCFNGTVKLFKVDYDRFIEHHANYYDPDGNILEFSEAICPSQADREIILPDTIKEMIRYAEILAEGSTFMRVDFYDVDGRVYFGEITFFPAAGFGVIHPSEWNEKLGDMMQLPEPVTGSEL